ncbi:MAG: glycosyltransferase [Treponema sp.]|nr:glycosyltransferase [Treponema sp.]
MAKVSVILPIYNTSQYLHEALDSVTKQTLKDIEIICINDGSKDNSLNILKEYSEKDDRIIIIDKKNTGYGHSMNTGIDTATGEYLGILETDDFLSLNMFEDLYSIAAENDLDTIKADFYRFTRDNEKNMNLKYIKIDRGLDYYNKICVPSLDALYIQNTRINTWTGLYRLSFLRENNIRHNETPGASFQDNGFFWQVHIYSKRLMQVNKPYYYCRRDNPNSSTSDKNKVWAMSREYDFIRDILMRDKVIWNRNKNIYWLNKYWNYNFIINMIAQEYKYDFFMRMSREFNRALVLDEISKDVFSDIEWSNILIMINNPENYFKENINNNNEIITLKKENIELKKQITNKQNENNRLQRQIKIQNDNFQEEIDNLKLQFTKEHKNLMNQLYIIKNQLNNKEKTNT